MTNEELTEIYNEANGLDPKRHNPITTERIFAAMLAAMNTEREACKQDCRDVKRQHAGLVQPYHVIADECIKAIEQRSNA